MLLLTVLMLLALFLFAASAAFAFAGLGAAPAVAHVAVHFTVLCAVFFFVAARWHMYSRRNHAPAVKSLHTPLS